MCDKQIISFCDFISLYHHLHNELYRYQRKRQKDTRFRRKSRRVRVSKGKAVTRTSYQSVSTTRYQ